MAKRIHVNDYGIIGRLSLGLLYSSIYSLSLTSLHAPCSLLLFAYTLGSIRTREFKEAIRLSFSLSHTHRHTHTNKHIYICIYVQMKKSEKNAKTHIHNHLIPLIPLSLSL